MFAANGVHTMLSVMLRYSIILLWYCGIYGHSTKAKFQLLNELMSLIFVVLVAIALNFFYGLQAI